MFHNHIKVFRFSIFVICTPVICSLSSLSVFFPRSSIIYPVLSFVHCLLSFFPDFLYSVRCSRFSVACPQSYVLYPASFVLCPLSLVLLRPLSSVLYPLFFVISTQFSDLCPLLSIPRSSLPSVLHFFLSSELSPQFPGLCSLLFSALFPSSCVLCLSFGHLILILSVLSSLTSVRYSRSSIPYFLPSVHCLQFFDPCPKFFVLCPSYFSVCNRHFSFSCLLFFVFFCLLILILNSRNCVLYLLFSVLFPSSCGPCCLSFGFLILLLSVLSSFPLSTIRPSVSCFLPCVTSYFSVFSLEFSISCVLPSVPCPSFFLSSVLRVSFCFLLLCLLFSVLSSLSSICLLSFVFLSFVFYLWSFFYPRSSILCSLLSVFYPQSSVLCPLLFVLLGPLSFVFLYHLFSELCPALTSLLSLQFFVICFPRSLFSNLDHRSSVLYPLFFVHSSSFSVRYVQFSISYF